MFSSRTLLGCTGDWTFIPAADALVNGKIVSPKVTMRITRLDFLRIAVNFDIVFLLVDFGLRLYSKFVKLPGCDTGVKSL